MASDLPLQQMGKKKKLPWVLFQYVVGSTKEMVYSWLDTIFIAFKMSCLSFSKLWATALKKGCRSLG